MCGQCCIFGVLVVLFSLIKGIFERNDIHVYINLYVCYSSYFPIAKLHPLTQKDPLRLMKFNINFGDGFSHF